MNIKLHLNKLTEEELTKMKDSIVLNLIELDKVIKPMEQELKIHQDFQLELFHRKWQIEKLLVGITKIPPKMTAKKKKTDDKIAGILKLAKEVEDLRPELIKE